MFRIESRRGSRTCRFGGYDLDTNGIEFSQLKRAQIKKYFNSFTLLSAGGGAGRLGRPARWVADSVKNDRCAEWVRGAGAALVTVTG